MRMRVTRFGIFFGLAAVLGIFAGVQSEEAADEFILQVSDATGPMAEATYSAIAFNSTDNQYLVVWEQENAASNGTTDEIFGQLLQGDGTKIGTPFRISTSDLAGNELGAGHPDVTYDGQDNQYYAVWESDVGSRDFFRIRGREIEANGTLVGGEYTVAYPLSALEQTDARHPAVTYNTADHRYAVAYEMTKAFGPYTSGVPWAGVLSEIWLTVLDANEPPGVVYWSSQGIESSPSRDGFAPDIDYGSTDDEYLVVWTRDTAMALGQHEILGARCNSGGFASSVFQVSNMQGGGTDRDGFDPAVGYNETLNDYFFTWCGDGVGPADTLQNDAYETWGELLQADGTIKKDDFVISSARDAGADRDAYRPAAVYNGYDMNYVVLDEADAGALADDTYEVFARRVESNGDIGVPYVSVSNMSDAGADRDGRVPAAAYNSQYHNYMVTWNGDGGAASNDDDEVFANRSYLIALPVLFSSVGANVVDGVAVEITWTVIADEELSGFRIYRQEGENSPQLVIVDGLPANASEYTDTDVLSGGTYRYVVSAVKPDGSEVRSIEARVTVTPGQYALGQNFPNPFNPTTTIPFELADKANVSIVIFDVMGHEVYRLLDEVRPAGRHEATWYGQNNLGQPAASGTYFYRLTVISSNNKTFSAVKKLVLMK